MATVDGVTEVRAGTYVFNDLMQIALGRGDARRLALTVLATVVSVTGDDTATIDCGSKTFAGDTGVVGGSGLAAPRPRRVPSSATSSSSA